MSDIQTPTTSILRVPDGAHPSDNPLALPETGFVRQRLLLRLVPFSKSTLWRRVKTGDFPAPIKLSTGITAWKAEDVRGWIAARD